MKTNEARDVLIDYQSGGTLIPENEFKMMEALQVAIEALEQPKYHYLPEVPQDGETVPVYVENKKGWQLAYIREGFWQTLYGKNITPYAWTRIPWTRIPPKPPVREGGQS